MYNKKIKDLQQPMLISRPKARAQGEKKVEKEIWLVPELCHLTGLTQVMREDFR